MCSINPGNITDLIALLPDINRTWTDKGIRPKVSVSRTCITENGMKFIYISN